MTKNLVNGIDNCRRMRAATSPILGLQAPGSCFVSGTRHQYCNDHNSKCRTPYCTLSYVRLTQDRARPMGCFV